MDGGNGCLYGIPKNAPRVLEFNLENKSIKEIGPDLGIGGYKYGKGIRANNGSIYCPPSYKLKPFLKITPLERGGANVRILDEKKIPENGYPMWLPVNGVLADKDECIYFMPEGGSRILKLDPNNDDSLSLVGREMRRRRYPGAILGNDGCIYGIPSHPSTELIKFDPSDQSFTEVLHTYMARQGYLGYLKADANDSNSNIYACNKYGQILKLDTVIYKCTIIGSRIFNGDGYNGLGWHYPVLGADKCIYFPPFKHGRVLKFNPSTQNRYLIGDSHGFDDDKWSGSCLATNGYIYCVPSSSKYILEVDTRPLNEKILQLVQSSVNNT